jgi:DnaK suppressor protein
MSAHIFNLELYRAALLFKAPECRKQLLEARQDIRIETELEDMDRALDAAEREKAARRAERSSRLLLQVESALSRMKHRRYGVCLNCEEAIGEKRLEALSWAPFCVDCQQALDLLHQGAEARRNEIGRAA